MKRLAVVGIGVVILVAGLFLLPAIGGPGLSIHTGGPPAMDCGDVDPEVCEQALRERLSELEPWGIEAEAVTRFKFRSPYGGTCGDSDTYYAAWTFGPVAWVTYALYRPLCGV